ncbi:polysaccharide deacetylase [Paenibacillus larvae subsp. larvae]|uniref:Polysaccharide deacetylase family protein n=2 Tax=Paenibacillus larvae TaxID=1464 RepID=A0A1U9YUE8_9BACL|nr:polysaccharide deacetylase family protein [Paenibacillus larvae]AQT86776.1 polysaccharide deacetylase family protein [Paenibacillus larvae subsp. pulvifaciens]AQZ49063.1 polysaccharide deacetylase family protein [Paenibacillus larvae subsp. pulvifaciens]ARF70461.1 polysaccharide deacetylase family protein [Paenibacillus larvae subsp. pulvifaciens]AVF28461.1 polysaccharide deacetylase [Paenibacillus larvae subsp. larvae]AVF32964.1 polysaccharide deacetylase [Paenibacillus larvae subsp. larva
MLTMLFTLSLEFIAVYMMLPYILTRICGIGVFSRGKSAGQIAFTFDDGPDPRYTPELLDLLNEYGVKATFFVLGSKAEKYPELIRRICQEGHQIGIHNYVHKANWIMSPSKIRREQVERSADTVEQITGIRPAFYRPPWGLLNLGDFLFLRRSYRIVLWSLMAGDWKQSTSADKLKHILLKKIRPGTIIVLHDSGDTFGADEHAPEQMLQGLRDGLKEIRQKGYEYVRIDELLGKDEKRPMEKPQNGGQAGTSSHEKVIT